MLMPPKGLTPRRKMCIRDRSRWVEESGLDDYEGDPEDGEDWHYYEYYGWEARNKWLHLNDGSGDEAWYEFDSQGRMATDSDAKKAPKDQVEAVELSDGEDDTVEMKVGQEVTVKFDVVLASDSDAKMCIRDRAHTLMPVAAAHRARNRSAESR